MTTDIQLVSLQQQKKKIIKIALYVLYVQCSNYCVLQ